MTKKLFIFLALFSIFLLTACEKPKTIILFNNEPITNKNFLNNSSEFKQAKRFYYLFVTEKPLETDFIRVRILKKDEKAGLPTTKLIYSNDFRLNKDQIYYYTDYIVINEAGCFLMVIYAKNKLDRPLATAEFRVK